MSKPFTQIQLTDAQWLEIEAARPDSGSSGAVKGRAEALARIHIFENYPGGEFVAPCNGADMAVLYQGAKINFDRC